MKLAQAIAKLAVNSFFALLTVFRLKLLSSPALIILTYHRVLPAESPDRAIEQPGMVVTPESLERHILLLKRLGASFSPLTQCLKPSADTGRSLPRLSVAITLDDGWRDNYSYAFPILRKHNVPATIFLVSRRIDSDFRFWPERVLDILMNQSDKLNKPEYSWLYDYCQDAGWAHDVPMTLEQADKVISKLKDLKDHSIERLLDRTENLSPADIQTGHARLMLNTEELQDMSRSGLVSFGAHTRHHYRLNLLETDEQLTEEIAGCRSELISKGLGPAEIFCYPNGNTSDKSEEIVKEHYLAACTTETGWNHFPLNKYNLKRFSLHDGNSSNKVRFFATLRTRLG